MIIGFSISYAIRFDILQHVNIVFRVKYTHEAHAVINRFRVRRRVNYETEKSYK